MKREVFAYGERSVVVRRAAWAGLLVLVASLLARILTYPLNHDEQLFITAAAQLQSGRLYDDLGYNHLPNLPYMLNGIYGLTRTAHFLLVGRIVAFLFWIAALAALWLIAHHQTRSRLVAFTAMLLLLGNVLLLGQPGMLVSNNFIPSAIALYAFYFLLRGLNEERPLPFYVFLAGAFVSLAVGFKASHIFMVPPFAMAVLVAPASRAIEKRITQGMIPLALGGLVGGIPSLAYLATNSQSVLAHTVRYFVEVHTGYWANSDEPKIVTTPAKIILAEQTWLSGANLLALCGIFSFLLVPFFTKGLSEALRRLWHWPLIVAASLIALGVIVSFVPSPSFPQYLVPPVPFFIVALVVAYGRLDIVERRTARPLLAAICLLATIGSLTRLLPHFPDLVRPSAWTGVQVHREATALAQGGGLRPGDRVATLSPVNALEGGLSIYPEFAAGPFVYRIAERLPEKDRVYYRTTSKGDLHAFLDAHPPAAVMTGLEGELDMPFVDYAISRGYREVAGRPQASKEAIRLYVRPR